MNRDTVHVSTWPHRLSSWFLLLHSSLMLMLVVSENRWTLMNCALLAAFGLVASISYLSLRSSGRVSLDADSISIKRPFGLYSVRWGEVERVDVGTLYFRFVTNRGNLSVPCTEFWTGATRGLALELFESSLEQHSLVVRRTLLADVSVSSRNLRCVSGLDEGSGVQRHQR